MIKKSPLKLLVIILALFLSLAGVMLCKDASSGSVALLSSDTEIVAQIGDTKFFATKNHDGTYTLWRSHDASEIGFGGR